MLPKASLKFAALAGIAGLMAGYASHRADRHARALAVLQGIEWFLSAGGASWLTTTLRRSLEAREIEVTERLTHVEETVLDEMPGRGR